MIDISSSEDEGKDSERTSTPLPRPQQTNHRVVIEISHSSACAAADEEEYFDLSADSLEKNWKRMRLNSRFESLRTDELANSEAEEEQCLVQNYADSPESPDPSLNSDVFVVEKPHAVETTSMTSSDFAEFVRQATEDDADSYFVTPLVH